MSQILKKIAGLLVENTDASAQPSVAQSTGDVSAGDDAWSQWESIAKGKTGGNPVPLPEVIAKQPGPNIDSVSVSLPEPPANKPVDEFVMPKKREDSTWDFSPIYVHSNLQPPAFTAEQAREIIATLPDSLSLEIRRETVSKTIGAIGKSLGITPDVIASDAALKIAAVEDFRGKVKQQFSEYEVKAQQAIAEYERKIAETRLSIESAKSRSSEVMNACDAEIDKLDDVTEFFTLDTGTSKHAETVNETAKTGV